MYARTRFRFLSILIPALILCASAAIPATYVVRPDGTGDFPTIQAAIDQAEDHDLILLGEGVFTGPGNRDISFLGKPIVVRSESWDPEACVIDCEGDEEDPHRGFLFISGESDGAILAAVTITNGYAPMADFLGGAIKCGEHASPQIQRCRFVHNTAFAGGALMGEWLSAPRIENCLFVENYAQIGGALAFRSPSAPTLASCDILRHTSVWGGAVAYGGWRESVDRGGRVQVVPDRAAEHAPDSSRRPLDAGAGTRPASAVSRLLVKDCTFRENKITSQLMGGGIYFVGTESSWMTICSSLFCGNGGGAGSASAGAIYFAGSETNLSRITYSTFALNDAGGEGVEGSCIRHAGGDLLIDATIMAINHARPVHCGSGGSIDITCSDIQGNVGGDWTDCIEHLLGTQGNFSDDPLFCDPYHWNFLLATDSPCLPPNNECGYQIGGVAQGCDHPTALASDAHRSWHTLLGQNQPNPFNPMTRIDFFLPTKVGLNLAIYDVTGRRLRVLADGMRESGKHKVTWDGRDAAGRQLPSGVYLYRLETPGFCEQRKMTLLR